MTTATSQSTRPHRPRWPARRTATLIAALAWVLGVSTIVSAVLPAHRDRLRYLISIVGVPVEASAAATGLAAVLGILLLWLANGLRRRKRRAWQASVAVVAVLSAAHVVKGLDLEETGVALALLGLLIHARREFHALGDPVGRWFAVRVVSQFLLAGVVLGIAELLVNHDRIVGRPSVWAELEHVMIGLVGVHGPLRFTSERVDEVITGTLLGSGVLTVFVAAYLLLRPHQPPALLRDDDEARLRDLLGRWGDRDSLGYFALRRDKSVIWSATGKAAITYRVVNGVALASGDPIGDPEAWPGAIEEFMTVARQHAWVPGVIGCGELGATVWRRDADLDALELGDEAIVDVAGFSLDGRAMRGVRQACGRIERAGYAVRVRRGGDIPPDEFADLLAVAAAWRGAAVERGFSMALGRLGDGRDTQCVVVTAYQGAALRGILHFVPWGTDGLSLDLMRRDRGADNGLNEYMIVKLVEACPELGCRRLSLNFAVFRSALERGERIGAGPVLRAWRGLLVFASRWWQIETLYRFNLKFRPAWVPRFVSFPSSRDLPRIAVAALEAEAFLVRPRPLRKLVRR